MYNIVTKIGTAAELIEILRRCGTQGEPNLLPYEGSEISIEPLNIEDLVPLAKYVLQENLDQIAFLHNLLQLNDIDIFNLPGRLTWEDDRGTGVISPPIVEHWEDEGLLLVDGMHRVWRARENGRKIITCVVVRGVTTPLVPLPTVWKNVRVYPSGQMPETGEKRDFRFSDATSLRDAMPEIRDKVTDQNCPYFLFRDLGALGSTGIRKTPDNSTTEGITSNEQTRA